MPRRARLSVPGVAWHIIQRGHNRSPCFFGEHDYLFYLATLAEQAAVHGCAIHAYVLMTNHVHLLLTPRLATSVSALMKHLGQRYVQYVNRTYRRSGTLWGGRFKSCLAQDDAYVLTCYRYVEMNPVRAGLVQHPGCYPWSSYRCNALGEFDPRIMPHADYLRLGMTATSRHQAYRELTGTPLTPGALERIRDATNGNVVLGHARFAAQIARVLRRRVTPGTAGRPGTRGPVK